MKTSTVADKVESFQKRAAETAQNVCEATNDYVHENAWTSVALAAVFGCVVGFLLGRNRD
jgi:ElaB/YqjD/DUF883 family membrane-anchored ribosome-binding protein